MKVLVIGGSGVIGSQIVKSFIRKKIDVEFTYLKNKPEFGMGNVLDITKRDNTIELITRMNPDVVIHTTALANVDLCETNNVLADQINVTGTRNITDACKIIKSKIVYVSTPFVFDGTREQYFEDDVVSPATYYGITKYKGEEITRLSGLPYLILRTDQPYCWIEKWQHTNSVLRAIDTIKSNNILKEITDWYNVPTYVPDFVEAASKLLSSDAEGIFHVVGSEYINRYNWSLKVAEIFNLDKKMIKPIASDTLGLPTRRVNVNLNNNKIRQSTGVHMSNIKEGLIKMIEEKE
ncbi:MAG TPA: sugar nucleotide-binding protein [Candidatus Nitrosotalea sp.]|nr:sugar nucleotide-binding protein [Candidatus Nitrosotalea sp.]